MASNWDAGIPATGAPVVFSSATGGGTAKATTLDKAFNIVSLTFNATQTGNVTIASGTGSNTLTLTPVTNGATTISVDTASGDHTISTSISLAGQNNQVFDIGANRTFAINAAISGSTGSRTFTKAGTGTLSLGGTTNNSFGTVSLVPTAGVTTTINAGILELAKTSTSAVHAISTSNITIGDASGIDILRLTGSGGDQITDYTILTFNGSGANAGTFQLNGKSETVGGLASTSGAGIIEDNNATVSTLTVNVTADQSFSGIIRDGAAGTLSLTKTGGAIQTLSGANTYSGVTTINPSGGTLKLDNAGSTTPRLAGTTSIIVNSGGTLLLASSSGTSNDRINNNASVTINGGGIFNTGGLNEGPTGGASGSTKAMGALTLAASSTIDFTSANSSNLLFDSLTYTPGSAVTIAHWTGTQFADNAAATNDRLLFISSTGLTDAQLASFQFTDDSGALLGSGATEIAFNGYFEIVPIPEPGTWMGAALAMGAILLTQRRRFSRLLKRA